ncbi:hypothetical protein [Citricoccus sp. I39-566]|uniref:hypothetical protein n=1 Tax=Citricoccus sp. I39-566 TaxID=3073268 RepID=UPI00286BA946|nr:hypothetical protein [Citricoccus sp. I39-566]WMY79417.1 hypothetical protein RE421_06010 [Citricoccus sp. I39-566]
MAYVGQSGRLDPKSVSEYLGSGDLMLQAIDRYGESHFQKKVLNYFDDQNELDYEEIRTIAELRSRGVDLYNSGVGGPRAQTQFVSAMATTFGVLPYMIAEWHDVVETHAEDVKKLLASIEPPSADDFYIEYERQLRVTQDLSRPCARCGSGVDEVCRTRTGNPTRNHARR